MIFNDGYSNLRRILLGMMNPFMSDDALRLVVVISACVQVAVVAGKIVAY